MLRFFLILVLWASGYSGFAQVENEMAGAFCPCFKTLNDSASEEVKDVFRKAAMAKKPATVLQEEFARLVREGKESQLTPVSAILKDTGTANPVRCMDAAIERIQPSWFNEKKLLRLMEVNCPIAIVFFRIGQAARN